MAYLRLSILLSLLLLSPHRSTATSPTSIFILAGQSNMSGRGGVEKDKTGTFVWDGYIPPECQPNPSILRLNPAHEWEPAAEPLHRGIDLNKTLGIGLGMPFAFNLLAKAGARVGTVGLVPSARGGSLISAWQKGTPFYNDLVERITAADKDGGEVRAMLWLQGESDASSEITAAAYKERLKSFFTDLRNDIKPRSLPIVLVKIASYDTYVPNETRDMPRVRAAADELHAEMMDVEVVDALPLVTADGEGLNKDRAHLNMKSEVTLGQWVADAYLSRYGPLL